MIAPEPPADVDGPGRGPGSNDQVVMTGIGGPEQLRTDRRSRPRPGRDGVVVQVEAAGVSYAEVQLLRGLHPFPPKMPCVPGYDLVGRVVERGAAVARWSVGDRVAAMPRKGAWQEYLELPAEALTRVPEDVDAGEAVALICNGVTAWQMLHRRARVQAGDTVLVHGAGGGVGSLLTALAVRHGVRVIGTASTAKHHGVRALGAEPVEYRGTDIGSAVRALAPDGVDAVFNHLGGRTLDVDWSLLKPGGTLVSFDSSVEGYRPGQWFRPHLPAIRRVLSWKLRQALRMTGGRTATMFYIKPGPDFSADLESLFQLLRSGALTPRIGARYPLPKAADALADLFEGRTFGKIVLVR